MLLNPQADMTITAPAGAEAGGDTAGGTTTAVIPVEAEMAAAIRSYLFQKFISG